MSYAPECLAKGAGIFPAFPHVINCFEPELKTLSANHISDTGNAIEWYSAWRMILATSRTAAILVSIFLTVPAIAGAENLTYKDLPGVNPATPVNPSPAFKDCGSDVVERYGPEGRELPRRIYSCSDGSVTIYSTEPPLDMQRPSDPYIHGEKLIGQ